MQESFFNDKEYVQPEMDSDGNMIYSVQECVFLINEAISRLGRVKVRGEISSLGKSKGTMAFFDLKDASGEEYVIQCSLFGWNFSKYKHLLEDGMEVVATGRPKVYEKRGTLSLVIDSLEPSGEGAWRKAFEALKKKLAAKGYFDEARKRSIPQFIQKIGLITSEDGQAIHDFQKNLGNYGFHVYLRAVWVEGDKAEQSIIKAFRWFNKNRPDMDILVLIRGGGGFENLKVFHSEAVADEIVSSRIPVITGIGHEKDESIADYVADKRLSTPTAVAAELTRQREDLIRNVDALWEDIKMRTESIFEEQRIAVQNALKELPVQIERVLAQQRFAIAQSAEKLHRGFGKVFEGFGNLRQRLVRLHYLYERELYNSFAKVEKVISSLSSLNPENVLQRGYSVVYTKDKKVLKDVAQVKVGESVGVRVYKGKFTSRIEEIEK